MVEFLIYVLYHFNVVFYSLIFFVFTIIKFVSKKHLYIIYLTFHIHISEFLWYAVYVFSNLFFMDFFWLKQGGFNVC